MPSVSLHRQVNLRISALILPAHFLRLARAGVAAAALSLPAASHGGPLGNLPGVAEFVADMALRHGIDGNELRHLFDSTSIDPQVLRYNAPADRRTTRSWRAYRARYVEPVRIAAGMEFWHAHAGTLRRAAERYGVPEEIIVSIIGVETVYGRHTGSFPTFSTLATLAFEDPRRSAFFRAELEQFLLLCRELGKHPKDFDGSFSGAIGLGQFMPGSYRRFGVDFDGDGRVDILENIEDAIGSVANFLAQHGWQRAGVVAVPARVEGDDYRAVMDSGIDPVWPIGTLARYGVSADPSLAPDIRAALIDLPTPGKPTEFYLGMNNFYVITRYNRSSFYAMSVFELARALRLNRERDTLRGRAP